jgi:hypothetical protein
MHASQMNTPAAFRRTLAPRNTPSEIADSYPFHPRLLDTAKDRLGALADFQRSRGVLRLFARIIRDVWERKDDVDLITAGEVDFSSTRIRGDLLQRLNKEQFEAAVSADVIAHASELDSGARGIHSRVASALMVESLPGTSNAGLTPDDLTLAVLRPDEAGPGTGGSAGPSDRKLLGTRIRWTAARATQFRVEPNVRKQIEERRNRIPLADAEARVQTEAQQYFAGAGFRVRNWPEYANAVPDVAQFQLVLCDLRGQGKVHGRPTATIATRARQSSGASSMRWSRSRQPTQPIAPPCSVRSR